MGLLRDAIGSALGGNEINNGLSGGTRLPFKNINNGRQTWRQSPSSGQEYFDPPNNGNLGYSQRGYDPRTLSLDRTDGSRQGYQGRQYQSLMDRYPDGYDREFSQRPPDYEISTRGTQDWYQGQSDGGRRYGEANYVNDRGFSRETSFRPLVLPQVAFGDGQPFLRGYSQELGRHRITMAEFIQALDMINIATIPSPENQIFQKGANIAGFFL
jgi:hypothetical protein